jgi:hypothetical protein
MIRKGAAFRLASLAIAAALCAGTAAAQSCEPFQLENYKQRYRSPEECWANEHGMKGATQACCEQALGRPAGAKPLFGTCECGVFMDPPEYCPKYQPGSAERKACASRNQEWLSQCNAWQISVCKP